MKTIINLQCAFCNIPFVREKRKVNGKLAFCSRSHSISYYGKTRFKLEHGMYGKYRKGCRCELCREANAKRMYENRHKVKTPVTPTLLTRVE